VKHRRLIELDKKARRVLVEDTLEMDEEHEVELFFHFSERCRLASIPGGFVASQDGVCLQINLPVNQDATARLYQGSLAPLCGWRSPAFDVRLAAPTAVWHARLTGPARLRTELCVSFL
jgi:hypothetical protein